MRAASQHDAESMLVDGAATTLPMDAMDHRIANQLRRDGRMPFKALAAELGLTEPTVRARVRRMEENNSLKVVAVSDFEAVGYSMMLAVGVQVEGRPAEGVAEDLAAFSEVFSVCQVVGSLDIETLVVAEDQAHVASLLGALAAVPGVRKLLPSIALKVLKNESHWVPFDTEQSELERSAHSGAAAVGSTRRLFDELDRKILAGLSADARTSNRKIAAELGVTEGTIRSRIKRMEADGQLRITAMTNISQLASPTLVYIWLELERSEQSDDVAACLAAVPEIGFVGKMLGRFDLLAITLVQDNAELAGFLHSHISGLAGVRRSECSLGVSFVKHDYRMSRIVAI
ncbi:MAG: Lrp/AsnC family transcriptional regulator [Spongiibacteraceae bacterium]